MIPYIDMHCDTLSKVSALGPEHTLYEHPTFSIDVKRLQAGGAIAQFFAVWLPPGGMQWPDETHAERLAGILKQSLTETFRLALSSQDIRSNRSEGALSAVLALEDCRIVTSLDVLETLFEMGFRSYGFTWNGANALGFPNSPEPEAMRLGLTPLGKEAVEWLNARGAVIDVSHLSDGGFWDILELSKKPVVATHSNARALTPHPRNLTDEMIRALAEKGGVSGLNFCCRFLSGDEKKNDLRDHVAHLNHMKNVGGEDFVALGSDLDGIGGELAIPDTSQMPVLFEALRKDGWTHSQVEKFAYKNALRVLGDIF